MGKCDVSGIEWDEKQSWDEVKDEPVKKCKWYVGQPVFSVEYGWCTVSDIFKFNKPYPIEILTKNNHNFYFDLDGKLLSAHHAPLLFTVEEAHQLFKVVDPESVQNTRTAVLYQALFRHLEKDTQTSLDSFFLSTNLYETETEARMLRPGNTEFIRLLTDKPFKVEVKL